FASSLDQIGPFTHTVDDTARLLDALSGHDSHDSTTASLPPTNALSTLNEEIATPVIGILPDELLDGCSDSVMTSYQSTLDVMKNAGWSVVTVELQGKDAWIPTYYILATAEASSNLARFDGVRYGVRPELGNDEDVFTATRTHGFGDEVKRRIMLGTYVLSSGYYDAYYKKGQQARRLVYDGYTALFTKCDALFLPTTPTTAFKRGEKSGNPIAMYLSDLFTVSANLAGIPAISFPTGTDTNGLPIGMQLQAATMRDEYLLNLTNKTVALLSAKS
ncbi:MAG: Asp-tRNA(Asn)/Glu-tRNA(Gln) amidotransferase subunit GatA, partial [Candidatus Kapabacteria bacterium]|nr:Asp-tRNA(Asn)/Glu-tRNA(Gln) amidotransferase subunit GatA [Candidatus Kapabacteria bacterium]